MKRKRPDSSKAVKHPVAVIRMKYLQNFLEHIILKAIPVLLLSVSFYLYFSMISV
jgi:hypothetical protein